MSSISFSSDVFSPTIIGDWSRISEVNLDASSPAQNPGHISVTAQTSVDLRGAAPLLRKRLKGVALVVCVALGILTFSSFLFDSGFVPGLRAVVLVAGIMCAVTLYSPRPLDVKSLRQIELLLFIPCGLLAVMAQFYALHEASAQQKLLSAMTTLSTGTTGFAILVLAYGMFMPNGWRRTALMIAPPCFAPGMMAIVARTISPQFEQGITVSTVALSFLVMFVVGGIAVYGTWTISTLRREAQIAKRLGQYQLLERIGSGGMGEVYLAEHQLLKRRCAIKLIHPKHLADPMALARFEHEVQSTAKLSHWNTVEIYDYGHTEDGTFYYVMEYLPGKNLFDLVRTYGPLPPARAIHFIRQTAQALHEAHQMGLIHRDLKPANIFASHRGGAYDVTKLLDFGLVLEDSPTVACFDQRQQPMAGSPAFMSPEQADPCAIVDARSDLYSLGGVAYFLLTGRPPFVASSPMKLIIAHARDEVTPPSTINPQVPSDLEQVVLKLLAKKPEQRYQSCIELIDALSACRLKDRWTYSDAAHWWKQR